MALLRVVIVDPAPADLVFVVVIAVAAVTGRLALDRVPRTAVVAIVVFATLNLVSAVEVVDPGRAASFFSITLYLAVLALWLTRLGAKPNSSWRIRTTRLDSVSPTSYPPALSALPSRGANSAPTVTAMIQSAMIGQRRR